MMLWITVLYNRKYGHGCLTTDLKHATTQGITRLVGETGCYRLLLFARESPQRVNNVLP